MSFAGFPFPSTLRRRGAVAALAAAAAVVTSGQALAHEAWP